MIRKNKKSILSWIDIIYIGGKIASGAIQTFATIESEKSRKKKDYNNMMLQRTGVKVLEGVDNIADIVYQKIKEDELNSI